MKKCEPAEDELNKKLDPLTNPCKGYLSDAQEVYIVRILVVWLGEELVEAWRSE